VWGAAVVALVVGVAMALARPEPAASSRTAAQPAARALPPPPGAAPNPSAAADEAPPPSQPEAEAHTPKRVEHPGNRTAHARVDRAVARDPKRQSPAVTAAPAPRTSDAVLRGALPSRSGEGYPDLP